MICRELNIKPCPQCYIGEVSSLCWITYFKNNLDRMNKAEMKKYFIFYMSCADITYAIKIECMNFLLKTIEVYYPQNLEYINKYKLLL